MSPTHALGSPDPADTRPRADIEHDVFRAGLAAGLGLAALASHFGFGEELASMLMIGLLVMAVIAVIGFVMEASRKIVSRRMGTVLSKAIVPIASTCSRPRG